MIYQMYLWCGPVVLIESDWNLKTHISFLLASYNTVLIESDWNLKFTVLDTNTLLYSVLIESDWNLKMFTFQPIDLMKNVLIESDWNLKTGTIIQTKNGEVSINRIRLEFKVLNINYLSCNHPVLIESDWNLKLSRDRSDPEQCPY